MTAPGVRAVDPATVFQVLGLFASAVAGLKSIIDNGRIADKLDDVLTRLQVLGNAVITATAEILEAIDGIRRQIDEDLAFDNMTLADKAFFSEMFDDQPAAKSNSLAAGRRLERETDLVFASPFMYVVNTRLAILKALEPNYFCDRRFQEEFRGYRRRLSGWRTQLDAMIARSHFADAWIATRRFEDAGERPVEVPLWRASHTRDGVVVATFDGPLRDLSDTARQRVLAQAEASRLAGVEEDRLRLGSVAMVDTIAAWEQAFTGTQRSALVSGLLNRTAKDTDVVRVDGRLFLADPTLRATLLELLTSREFQGRCHASWTAFLDRGDDRLVQLAYRRLFERDATSREVTLLRDVASAFGYSAFTVMLLSSTEYEKRYGNGLPSRAAPLELPA